MSRSTKQFLTANVSRATPQLLLLLIYKGEHNGHSFSFSLSHLYLKLSAHQQRQHLTLLQLHNYPKLYPNTHNSIHSVSIHSFTLVLFLSFLSISSFCLIFLLNFPRSTQNSFLYPFHLFFFLRSSRFSRSSRSLRFSFFHFNPSALNLYPTQPINNQYGSNSSHQHRQCIQSVFGQ